MAADQRRKRLNGASAAGFNSMNQYRMKRRKLESLKRGLSSKSHISLEWDGNQKKVVAKREQIGISWRNLRPFVDSVPGSHSVLGDVISIPHGTLQLENLMEVLSYEAWETQLSEDERYFLMQFLPSGQNVEEVVQALLSGDNFHFGNSFLKWGASLCSGNLHPDAILHKEQCLKAEKKAYYSEMRKYHNDIIEYLQKLKDRWESCKDPEKEILPKIWRSRKHSETKIFLNVSESRQHDLEHDVTATSESCSYVADERACSSDNQNSSVVKGGELQKRIYETGFMKDKSRNPLITSDDLPNVGLKSKKGEKLNKRNISHSDGAKYMSYFKISKKQHELVKSMKQSGKSIQSRSLNRVLGNLDSLHVQPYEVFVEEEQKKLHEHWLQLAIKDIPAFCTKWEERRLRMWEITQCLGQEMKDRVILREDEEEEEPVVQDEMKENPESSTEDQKDDMTALHESNTEDDEESIPGAPQDQSPQQITSPGESHEFDQMGVDPEDNHVTSKSDNSSSDASGHMGETNTADETVNEEVPLSSSGDVWPAISQSHSYYDSNASHEFTSSGLPLMNPQVNEDQQAHMIDLESNLHEEDMRKDLLHRQPDDDSLSSYQNQDRNELLQSLFKDQGMLSYHQEQKQTGLDFQPPNNLLMAVDGQFPGHFQEQLVTSLPLEQGQKRLNDIFMQQNISDSIYSDRGRYLIPRQENLQPGNMQNWTVNPVRVSEPLEHHINGGELMNQNWFSGEHQVRGGWTTSGGVSIQNQSIGNGNNADQSLFSVLSNCNQLRSISPYDQIGSTEQFISSRSYGLLVGGAPGISNSLPHPAHPLDYLGGRDAAASVMPDDMGWMNLPHQNQALHDQMGKPYLRSWNQ